MVMLTKQQALAELQQIIDPSVTWEDYFELAKNVVEQIPQAARTAENIHAGVMAFSRTVVEQIQNETVQPTLVQTIDLAEVNAEAELNQSARELARVKVNDLAATFTEAYSEDFGIMVQNLKPLLPQIDNHAGHQLVLKTLHALETEKRRNARDYRNSILDVIQNTLRITFVIGIASFAFNVSLLNCGLNGLAASALISPVVTWCQNKKARCV